MKRIDRSNDVVLVKEWVERSGLNIIKYEIRPSIVSTTVPVNLITVDGNANMDIMYDQDDIAMDTVYLTPAIDGLVGHEWTITKRVYQLVESLDSPVLFEYIVKDIIHTSHKFMFTMLLIYFHGRGWIIECHDTMSHIHTAFIDMHNKIQLKHHDRIVIAMNNKTLLYRVSDNHIDGYQLVHDDKRLFGCPVIIDDQLEDRVYICCVPNLNIEKGWNLLPPFFQKIVRIES